MVSYIVRRLTSMIIVLVCITMITFIIAYAIPADPARVIAGPHAPDSVVKHIRLNLGLNKPIYIQYLIYIDKLIHGNLGFSYINHMPVLHLIYQRMSNSSKLALCGWMVELLIGIPLGIITALRHKTITDYSVSFLALLGLSLPQFWFGMWLIYTIAFKLNILPIGGGWRT